MPPTSLIDSLQAVRIKVRRLAIFSGLGITVAAMVGLLLAIVLLDWSLGLDKLPRLLLLVAAGFGLLYVLWHWLATPAMARLNIGDVAGRLEHTFPQFDDRLRSTVNFVQGDIPGSEMMKRLVVNEANALAGQVNLHRVIVRRPFYYSTLAAVASVALLAGMVMWGNHSGWLRIAANRLLLGNDQWPKSVEIALDGTLPERVAVGQRIPVKIHLAKGDKESRKARILYRYDNGPWQEEIMTRKDRAYTAMLDARLEQGHKLANLEVKFKSGDDEVAPVQIAVVPRLEIAHVDAQVTPPDYVKPTIVSTVNLTERPAAMAVGSTVALRINFNKPLKNGAPVEVRPVKDGQKLPRFAWDRSTPGLAIASFAADKSFRFTVKATDSDGFQNAGGEEYELVVKEDQPPTVQIEEPKRSEDRTPNAGFELKAVAEDDYGIPGARLIVDRVGGAEKSADAAAKPNPAAPPQHWVIDLVKDGVVLPNNTSWEPADSGPDRKRYHLGYHWELATLPNAALKPGDVLEYYVQVKDNFSLNGKEHDWVNSGKLRITIISLEEFIKQEQAKAEMINAQLKAEKIAELRQKAETTTLKSGLDRNKKFDEPDKAQASRLANDQANTQSQTAQLADRLAQIAKEMAENKAPEEGLKKTAEQVEKELRHTAESAMREAKKSLDAAKEGSPQEAKAQDSKAQDAKSPDAKSKSQNGKPQDAKPGDQKSSDSKNSDAKSSDSKSQKSKNAAEKAADQAKAQQEQAKDAAERSKELDKATNQQQTAADQLQRAMDKLGEMDGLAEAIKKLEEAKAAQEKLEKEFADANKKNVGKNPDELNKKDKDQNKELADKQNDQSKTLDQTLDKMDKKADKSSKSDPATSKAMKDAAQMGKQAGLPSKQKQAAQDMQENQQAKAQQGQRQVELGLDQIINRLKEAQRKQLEELARQLAELQQLVNELIIRQSGHNIDNLLIQGGMPAFLKLDAKDREDLLAYSGREEKTMPPAPQLGQLTSSQEQTYTNAVDVARQAEKLPDPAPAAKLTEAAGHMERAIVQLRANKLADAYKPPQVDALATLLEAQKDIAAAAEKAKKDLDDQDSETIKQAYIALLEKQKKIGDELRRINGLKAAGGEIPRNEAVKLGAMPGKQGELIKDADKIGEQLKQLGSVVYDWANKDIIKSMGKVKDNLAKPDTGKPTQAAEKHTEDQLQDMIDSLIERIRKSEFASRGGDGKGGQGQQKPKMPSEAELRLLKKNQEAVNDGTKDQAAEKKPDKEELASLSNRQNEVRNIFDKLIQKVTQGKQKLAPPPDPNEDLPKSAKKEDLDNKEIQDDLLGGKVTDKTVDKGLKGTGDNMSRSSQRLAKNDPGELTQEIQRRIVVDIDDLIKMAQKTQSNSKPKPGAGQKQGQPKPQPGQPQDVASKPGQKQQNGQTAAQQSTLSQGSKPDADISANIKELAREWGMVTGRQRGDVQEGASEEVVKKYQKLVEDYYRSLGEQASKH